MANHTLVHRRHGPPQHEWTLQREGRQPAAVRVFFIPAGARFTAENLNAGNYDVRYQALDDGSLARSEDFSLTERETYNGNEYSTIEMTLYKVTHGNMQTYPLSPADF